jgi:predicted membrane protein
MEDKSTNRKLVVGVILMVAGALLLLDTFNITSAPLRYYIFSWKTLFIGIGAVILATKEKATFGYVLIGIGVISWLPSFVNYNVSLSQVFWPAILIGVGVLIITRRSRTTKRHQPHSNYGSNSVKGDSSDYIDDVSVLGGGTKIIQSKNFKGGDITAIFGGSEFSFKEAELSPDGCTIDVFTMFGGSKLIIPDNWVVKSDMFSIFGGFNDKRTIKPEAAETTNVLYLKGAIIFGGMEVKSF